ncbi:Squalene/phytoene synthase-domain-containing protein [Gongronella butleri]|nr:Squalene/phytoene synthase-domain-containing protein [Gongronella butleri]
MTKPLSSTLHTLFFFFLFFSLSLALFLISQMIQSLLYPLLCLITVIGLSRPFITKLEGIKTLAMCIIVVFFSVTCCVQLDLTTPHALALAPHAAADYCSAWPLHQQPSCWNNATSHGANLHQIIAISYHLLANALVWMDVAALLTCSILALFTWHMITHWQFTILYVGIIDSARKNQCVRYIGSTVFILMGYYFMTDAFTSSESPLASKSASASSCPLSAIFCFLLGLLWQYSGPFYVNRRYAVGISAVAPALITAYGYDRASLGAQGGLLASWTLVDWLLGTLVVVCASAMLDNADALLHTYPQLASCGDVRRMARMQTPFSVTYWCCMYTVINDVLCQQHDLNADPVHDLVQVIAGLGPSSRSWKTMAVLFPTPLRQEMCILYGFFRACDDLVDDAPTLAQRHENLQLIRAFMRICFTMNTLDQPQLAKSGKKSVNGMDCSASSCTDHQEQQQQQQDSTLAHHPHIDWPALWDRLDHNPMAFASFRAFARISDHLCPDAADDLCKAWKIDLLGSAFRTQQDLLAYAALISGKFGELCTCVIMYKTGRGNWNGTDKQARNEDILRQARATGQCLQLVNIARDILRDSLEGRCYIPLSYMTNSKVTFEHLRRGRPQRVGNDVIREYSTRVLDLAGQIECHARAGIDCLPEEMQDSLRAAFEIYVAIGPVIRDELIYPFRAKVPSWKKRWVAFKYLYGLAGISDSLDQVATMLFGKQKVAAF